MHVSVLMSMTIFIPSIQAGEPNSQYPDGIVYVVTDGSGTGGSWKNAMGANMWTLQGVRPRIACIPFPVWIIRCTGSMQTGIWRRWQSILPVIPGSAAL